MTLESAAKSGVDSYLEFHGEDMRMIAELHRQLCLLRDVIREDMPCRCVGIVTCSRCRVLKETE